MLQASAIYRCLLACIVILGIRISAVGRAHGDETAASPDMDLDQTVALALEANLAAQISTQRSRAADAVVKSRRTAFLPTFSAQYSYTRNDEPRFSVIPTLGVVQPEEPYAFVTSVTQPLFTGFAVTMLEAQTEVAVAELEIQIREKEISLAQKGLFSDRAGSGQFLQVGHRLAGGRW